MESSGLGKKIFFAQGKKTAAEACRGRVFREEGRSGDDQGGLGECREGARHERSQSKHEAGKPDQHWQGSFLRRVSGEVKLGVRRVIGCDGRHRVARVHVTGYKSRNWRRRTGA